MRTVKRTLFCVLISTYLIMDLHAAEAKPKPSCSGMSKKELVSRIVGALDQMTKSYEACSSSQGCKNTALLSMAITTAFGAMGFATEMLITKRRTKALTLAGLNVGAGVANSIIADEKPTNADVNEMGEAINNVKKVVSNPEISVSELAEYCESLSQSIPLDDLVAALIQSGRTFIVHIGCDPAEDGYEKMGSIACGRDYKGIYKSATDTWTFEGYARDEKRNTKNSFKDCGNPVSKQICLWGRRYTFDQKGRVKDPDYGKIARLRFE